MIVLWLPVFSSWLSSARISSHDCPLAACLFFLDILRQISCHDCPLAACLILLAILHQAFLS
jgi:hypothetical protein